MKKECKYKAGDKIHTSADNYIKVMAVADGYVMFRNKGCIPLVLSVADFEAMADRRNWT